VQSFWVLSVRNSSVIFIANAVSGEKWDLKSSNNTMGPEAEPRIRRMITAGEIEV
jgi:hypothetical protein